MSKLLRPETYKPRLTIEISEEQFFRKQRLMPYGVQRVVFCILLDEILDLIEKHGVQALAPVLNKSLKLTEVLESTKGLSDGA